MTTINQVHTEWSATGVNLRHLLDPRKTLEMVHESVVAPPTDHHHKSVSKHRAAPLCAECGES